ncbi:MAG TPA: hypothetical protein VN766_18085 [Stellaceae bacterium]|jgi:hypothetical protein|nr:hypothetical protein [Stellaceae bacterium]
MKKLLTFALALGFAAGLSTIARADQTAMPAPAGQMQAAQLQAMPQQSAALDAYDHNLNALAVVPMTGPYDQADAYTMSSGAPLPGWSQMFDGGGEY